MSRINHEHRNARDRGHQSLRVEIAQSQYQRELKRPRSGKPRPAPVARETVEAFVARGGRIRRR